jgi:hypothetical protein
VPLAVSLLGCAGGSLWTTRFQCICPPTEPIKAVTFLEQGDRYVSGARRERLAMSIVSRMLLWLTDEH